MPETEIVTTDDRAIVEARIGGLSRRQVAQRFGLSVAVIRAAEKRFAEDASDLETERAILGEQLERIARVFYAKAMEGCARSAELYCEISRRRSELGGLDAPRVLKLEDQRPPEHRPSSSDLIEAALARVAAEHNGGTADTPSADDADKQLN